MLAGCGFFGKKIAVLVIENQADEQIQNVRIQYTSSKEVVEIGALKPKEKYEHTINNEQEDSITLYYTDSSGVEHEETAVGYIIKGMKGTTVLLIKNDNEGKWVVEKKK
ncbi:MAG TPA: hypothetical protein PLP73_01940 [Candidatus Absconditabacterales bacterium]|nr:hypothetical protein [Candidatus Absconditabacterales bacterium]